MRQALAQITPVQIVSFSVHLLTMPDTHNLDQEARLKDLVDHPVVTDPNAIRLLAASKLSSTWRKWIGG